MPKYDDLGSWKIFLSLAESRSFSVTAEAFGVEPSTISRTLGTLENSLGQKLVDRSARPLELTPKGLWAAKRIAPIIRSHEKLIDEMTEDSTGLEGQIRVSVAPGFATRYLVPMLARFSEHYPNITYEIQVGMGTADLKKQKTDVAIITGNPEDPKLVTLPRGRNIYLPLASPAYIKEHGMPLEPADLAHHTVFIYSGPVREQTRALRKGTLEVPVPAGKTLLSPDILSIRQGLIDGLGVSLDMPLVQCWEAIRDGTLVPILPGWRRPQAECFVALSRSSWHIRRCRIFAEWFASELRKLFRSFELAVEGIVPLESKKTSGMTNS